MASPKISLKLLVDKKGQRVLFAEAPKGFVDFLFNIFSLPLGTLIEFIGSKNIVGSLGKLKESIESFDETYLKPGLKMDDIFNPKTPFNGDTFLLPYEASKDQSDPSAAIYMCANAAPCSGRSINRRVLTSSMLNKKSMRKKSGRLYEDVRYKETCATKSCWLNATLYKNSICPDCSGYMNVKMTVVTPDEVAETKQEDKKNRGYVEKRVTYMVTDDLVVKPMSTISSIILMNKLGVKDPSQVEEKMVSFGKDEGLKLLMASLKTDEVLTTIFMN